MRGGHYAGSRGAAFAGPSRPYHDRAWYGIPDGGPIEPIPPRRPYSPGGQFDMPFMGRHFDDPYLYDDNMQGMKRPFYMTVRFYFCFNFAYPCGYISIQILCYFCLLLENTYYFELIVFLSVRTLSLITWGLIDYVLDWIMQIHLYFLELITMVYPLLAFYP